MWVYSNLEKVELFLNGQSLGTKEVKKDSHLAWNVPYAPGAIEARGYKGDKVVLTAKRETTGPAAKLIMTADRSQISADGEDVAMFAVEVRDAQDRIVPITDNVVEFKVSGAGKLIGTGNGDPTNQEPDKGTARKAFCGLCMAVVQSTKAAGNITVEASSPGLTSSSVTVAANSVTLRPQAAVWEREVPTGSGVTGLWRPMPASGRSNRLTALAGDVNSLFTLRQAGGDLTGNVEGAGTGGFFGGSDVPAPLSRRQSGRRPRLLQGRQQHLHRNHPRRPHGVGANHRCRHADAAYGRANRPAPGRGTSARWIGPFAQSFHAPSASHPSGPASCAALTAWRRLARQSKNDDACAYRDPSSMQARTRVIDA